MATFVIPPFVTDRLTAVNVLLASIGESPVNDVETSTAPDVGSASSTIDEVHRQVLTHGYGFNTNLKQTLSPATDGTIPLPVDTLFVGRAYGAWENAVSERARALYDRVNNTNLFGQPVVVDLVVYLSFEDCPEWVRRYVTIRAAQLFQARYQGEAVVNQVQDADVNAALRDMEAADDRDNPKNSIYGNLGQVGKLFGWGVRRRTV